MNYGYTRTTKTAPTLDQQRQRLEKSGVTSIFTDEQRGGTTTPQKQLNKAISILEKNDVLKVCAVFVLGKNLNDIFENWQAINKQGATLQSLKESWLPPTLEEQILFNKKIQRVLEINKDIVKERYTTISKPANAHRPLRYSKEEQQKIKELHKSNPKVFTQMYLAEMYNVTRQTIARYLKN